jgi:pimeloyl-ACP methyl ester carboxylesterase
MKLSHYSLALLCAASLYSSTAVSDTADARRRGAIVSSEVIGRFTRAAIDSDNEESSRTGPARCDVSVIQLTYRSIGVKGEPAVLSAGMFVPENCAGPFPILAEAHGTQTDRRRLTTEVSAGSGGIAFFAAHGYLVVATDYLGLGKSDYPFHPYLHAQSEASAIIDSIRAAKSSARERKIPVSDQLMLLGYSQGGHSAMAAQREIEKLHRTEFNLVASAPMAGPYHLSQTFVGSWFGRTAGEENLLAPELVAYTLVSYSKIYRNIYSRPEEVFAEPYAGSMERLFPGDQSLLEIRGQNLLPPANQINQLRNASFTAALLVDSHQPFLNALKANDLLDWTPAAPTLLCGSRRDAIVDFDNTYAAQAAFKARGVDVTVVDVADDIRDSASGVEHHINGAAMPCYEAARSRLFEPIKNAGPARQSALR